MPHSHVTFAHGLLREASFLTSKCWLLSISGGLSIRPNDSYQLKLTAKRWSATTLKLRPPKTTLTDSAREFRLHM